MKPEEWLTRIPIQPTPKGARLDLRLYVYPDGHGNFCFEDDKGQSVGDSQPVNNPAEAGDVLKRIWNRAMSLKLRDELGHAPSPSASPVEESPEAWIQRLQAWVDTHPVETTTMDDSRESIYAGRGE